MRSRRMFWALSVIVLLAAAYILAWQWDGVPREVIGTGEIATPDGQVLKTRQYLRASRSKVPAKTPAPGALVKDAVWEVQLPNGRWVDCDGDDCLATYQRFTKDSSTE